MMLHDQKFKIIWWLTSCVSENTLYKHGFPHWSKTSCIFPFVSLMDIMLCKEEMNIHAPLPVLFWVRVSCFLRTKKREAALGQAAKETKKQEALMSLVFTCLLSV